MFKACNQQAKSMNSLDFDYLRQLVRFNSAVSLDADKEYLAELHLANLAEQSGFDSILEFVEHLKTLPFSSLHVQAIESLLNYETTFFRDIYPFEILNKFVLPEIIKRQSQETINIWCAASSSGQEPYSIAMLLKEEWTMLETNSLQLIASDISSKALARARKGIYNQIEIRRGLPATLQQKYFYPIANTLEWQIDQEIRNMVDFRQINLLDSWLELPKMDIIFLRNVLIYFETPTKKKILSKIRQLLKPDGYLFLGGGETTLNLNDEFQRIQFGKGSCYKLGSRG
jgi:chemotaxis protein methyltransferase CheR